MCDVHSPIWNRQERAATLRHDCDECRFAIMPGERYVATSGKWEGEFSTYRAHLLCDMLAQQVSRDDYCRVLGELREFVSDGGLTPLQARWASSLLGREDDGED
jgi:hypothetical protein